MIMSWVALGQNLEHSVEEPPLGLLREMAARLTHWISSRAGEHGGRLMYSNKLEFHVKAVWMKGARSVREIRRSVETRLHVCRFRLRNALGTSNIGFLKRHIVKAFCLFNVLVPIKHHSAWLIVPPKWFHPAVKGTVQLKIKLHQSWP